MRAQAAFRFVERCKQENDIPALIEEFQARIADFGFTASVCGAWSGVGKGRMYRFYFNNWPADWLAIYERGKFFADDPLVAHARSHMTLFLWTEVQAHIRLTPQAIKIRDLTAAYGWREIIGVPIHGPAGYQGLVSLASLSDVHLSSTDRALIHLLALTIHDRCHSSPDFGWQGSATPNLTARELECVQWAAAGKTDWEIGQLMNITAATAHFHIEKVKKKLGIRSRVQAIVLMTLRGLI
ncbi:MAG: LuxR family transcriptional regulator [Pseudolabrys sp.]|nr:LuxR family transcriptional regulator [Pseudolabrys sp.]